MLLVNSDCCWFISNEGYWNDVLNETFKTHFGLVQVLHVVTALYNGQVFAWRLNLVVIVYS
jgi:hypothetical protein